MSTRTYQPISVMPEQGTVRVLDQTLLPHREVYLDLATVDDICEAIARLRVRGAPLLGLAGIAGVAVAASAPGASAASIEEAAERISKARPTAVDLQAGVQRAMDELVLEPDGEKARDRLWVLARRAIDEQEAVDGRIARHGAPLLAGAKAVLTHCNTGALATGGRGTALAVIEEAYRRGFIEECYATETRPLLQGARLTTWELEKLGIPAVLLPDSAAAALMASGRVGAVITGADRIAGNGDTANKVGTYGLALAAERHGVPFYIAAPWTTFDLDRRDGNTMPIEFREADEVGGFGEQRWSPAGTRAFNPAFDVTPAALIRAIISDRGVFRPPFEKSIGAAAGD